MIEMRWLAENGVCASWRDYEDMPFSLLEDCRLLMEADNFFAQQAERRRQFDANRR